MGAIVDSAGSSSGVPVNAWSFVGANNNLGIRLEWWACRSKSAITNLVVHVTGNQVIQACMLEYSGANGITVPNFQPLQPNQNTISTQYLLEVVATIPNSGAELMIGMFAMLNDTFNASPLEGTARSTNSFSIPPSFSYQIVEQGTVQPTQVNETVNVSGEILTLAGGSLNIAAWSASQLATANNVQNSTMQCLYIVISGGLILNSSRAGRISRMRSCCGQRGPRPATRAHQRQCGARHVPDGILSGHL